MSTELEKSNDLRAVSQQSRLRLINTELTLVVTWCSVAAIEAKSGEIDRLQQSLGRIKRAMESLKRRIDDPEHVPTELAPEFREKLRLVEGQADALETLARNS